MSQPDNYWDVKCGYCGQSDCRGYCRVTENTLDDEEIEPLDGDSFDDAWNRNIEEEDDDEAL